MQPEAVIDPRLCGTTVISRARRLFGRGFRGGRFSLRLAHVLWLGALGRGSSAGQDFANPDDGLVLPMATLAA